jgi:tetratricopeptide (TPR) repeat protein
VRQLNAALQRQADDGTALYLLSQAYAREGDFKNGEAAAVRAVKATPGNGEAHFWLGECKRHRDDPANAEAEYRQYLQLTNFNSGAGGQVNYYLAGFLLGMGKRHRAAEQDIWREQQGQAYLGICDCEWMQKRNDAAIPYCLKALSLLPSDLWANYRLGLIYVEQANARTQAAGNVHSKDSSDVVSLLKEAKTRFGNVIAANPDTDEASRARQYISRIDSALGSP